MLGLVAALREHATARRSGTSKLDALSARTVIGGRDLAPRKRLDQLLVMKVVLTVQRVDHRLRAFELAAPEQGGVLGVEPSVETFPLASGEGDVEASSHQSMPALGNRRRTRAMRRASHRVTGDTRGAARTRNRRRQRVARSARLASEHPAIAQGGPLALLLPVVAFLTGEVRASPKHPATGDLGLRTQIALNKNQRTEGRNTATMYPDPQNLCLDNVIAIRRTRALRPCGRSRRGLLKEAHGGQQTKAWNKEHDTHLSCCRGDRPRSGRDRRQARRRRRRRQRPSLSRRRGQSRKTARGHRRGRV
jgi:hypothetical protein